MTEVAGHTDTSPGVLLARYGFGAIVYNPVTETVHLADALTRALLSPDEQPLPAESHRQPPSELPVIAHDPGAPHDSPGSARRHRHR